MTKRIENSHATQVQHSEGASAQERATKVALSIRLDADVIDYFKAQGAGWQSRINAELRELMRLKHRDEVFQSFSLTGQNHPFVHHFAETSVPLRLVGMLPDGSLSAKKAR